MMKVKIKKDNKTKEFKLISSWAEVTLETWLKLIEFKGGSKAEEATETIEALSDIPKRLIEQLSLRDVALIMGRVSELQATTNSSFKRIVEIEGIEYGFHPNLDDITLGEYADLEQFIKVGLEENLANVMAVLYRPVVEKKNEVYTIEAYGEGFQIRAEQMKKMSAEQVQSALVFFYNLGKILWMTSQSYLMEMQKETKIQ